jgi:hypothetical protein
MPCAACQQQHSAETLAACEQPLQSLAVSAAMQIAGVQLHSEQRTTNFGAAGIALIVSCMRRLIFSDSTCSL